MFKYLIIFTTIVFTFAGIVFARNFAPATPAAKQSRHAIFGTIVSVNAAARQIVVKDPGGKIPEITVEVDDSTKIRKQYKNKTEKDIALSDIVAGDKVILSRKEVDNRTIATRILIRFP